MPVIKLHLEQAEYSAVERFAEALKVKPEAIFYSALNRLMMDARNPVWRTEIPQTWESHHDNLPLWSDSADGPHSYESKADEEPEPSRRVPAPEPPAPPIRSRH